MKKPLVALVGRPNVGKSALYNRLVGERQAVVSDVPGTTRDRLIGETEWNGATFKVVDTGGIEVYQPKEASQPVSPLEEGSELFVPQIRAQAMLAIEEADVIVMVVDAIQGITAADQEVADILHRSHKPVLVAANKADNVKRHDDAFEFYGLGLGEVFAVSALHGIGTGDLLDAVVAALPYESPEDYDAEDDSIKIAIVGRPNVGKSSLLNKLIGQDRVIVSDIAGTTRDAVDMQVTWEGIPITLIDTAGIRRRGRVEQGIEQYSVIRAQKAVERADVVLLVIDAQDGITQQDAHIAGMIQDEYKSAVIVINKWDAIEKDTNTMNAFMEDIRRDLAFLPFVPVVFISALTGQRIHSVLETAIRVQEERLTRIPTSELNRIVREAMLRHAPQTKQPRPLKIFVAQQVRVDPPTFLFHINDTSLLHFTYERYLENQIRRVYPFTGTPIRLSFRARERRKREK
ncbi:MAG TPA: ribosome biogenesis GTPase Der [Aggregatilinea sp.]|uniref:ribosome biogenesis GTPase Der n=1 Tax=Aggregatilinea sp. TaxID=2806333 RepID=UPI002B606D2A|nr:ribosome biogenesis GTPase Der [Aggregatilinea sp.]HML23367.1 ribosome biogenesis GTPase Der [Aggregatilinea sp.]